MITLFLLSFRSYRELEARRAMEVAIRQMQAKHPAHKHAEIRRLCEAEIPRVADSLMPGKIFRKAMRLL